MYAKKTKNKDCALKMCVLLFKRTVSKELYQCIYMEIWQPHLRVYRKFLWKMAVPMGGTF